MSYIAFIAYQDHRMNAYLWLMLGIFFGLPEIAKQAALAQAASQPTPAISGQG